MVKWLLLGTLLLVLGVLAVIFHESSQAPFASSLSMRFAELWEWIGDLRQGQGAFLGVFAGFLVLLGGLLLNAHLNRRRDALNRQRDEKRRQDECRSIAAALSGEVLLINRYARGNRQFLDEALKRGTLHTRTYPHEKNRSDYVHRECKQNKYACASVLSCCRQRLCLSKRTPNRYS